jgi:hypothetical protein
MSQAATTPRISLEFGGIEDEQRDIRLDYMFPSYGALTAACTTLQEGSHGPA